MTEQQQLLTAVGALAAVIAALWARLEVKNRQTEKRLADCESDRANLWRRLAEVAGRPLGGQR